MTSPTSTTACRHWMTSACEHAALSAGYQHRVRSDASPTGCGCPTPRPSRHRSRRDEHRGACELRFGTAKIDAPRLSQRLHLVLDQIPSLPLEAPVEMHYADIRNTLERAGTPIGPNDLLIAAQARALDLVLVSDNQRAFARVPELTVENWLTEPVDV